MFLSSPYLLVLMKGHPVETIIHVSTAGCSTAGELVSVALADMAFGSSFLGNSGSKMKDTLFSLKDLV